MRRLVARFEDGEDADAAEAALSDADLESERPDFENPLFDPTATLPEERGFALGALVGGAFGVAAVGASFRNLFVIPRLGPMMSADPLSLVALGLGLGVVVGGFVGGALGTMQSAPEPDEQAVETTVGDDRVDEAEEILRDHDATAVESRVTYHENPGMWSDE